MTILRDLPRRTFLKLGAGAGIVLALPPSLGTAASVMRRRPIPATGEMLPVIGLGTSDEFGVLPDDGGVQLKAVLTTLLEQGGTLIDTAPIYGDAERILGQFLDELYLTGDFFISTKVRERGTENGLRSMRQSQQLLGKKPLDLMMVHSLLDANTQLDNLERWKEEGRVRYIGITTSRSSDFEEMEQLIRRRSLDFIQVNYSPLEPSAAERVIPAAKERGVAVMVNRAFTNGSYFGKVRGHELPAWAADFDCDSWAQLSLKYILGHEDVTCVLAATSNPRHMRDNVAAGTGRLPDAKTRRRIEQLLQNL